MDIEQLTNLVMKPVLRLFPLGYSPLAVMAIQMIIAHESQRGHYISQLHGGPAAGFIQMEKRTHDSVWRYGETVWANAVLAGIITTGDNRLRAPPSFDRLLYDLRYNIFMARQRLFMKPEAFPNSPEAMSVYLKKHWNSVAGAADPDSYLKDWLKWK